MRAPIHVICRNPAGLGIALAGLSPTIAASGREAADALQRFAHEPARGGVVLIEQPLYDTLPPPTRRALRRDGIPIVMPFPPPGPPPAVAPEHELIEILRRAIGYRVRLR